MRTRRSPRNQERLWRYLGEEGKPKPEIHLTSIEDEIRREERILSDPFMSKSSKAVSRRRIENLKRKRALEGGK